MILGLWAPQEVRKTPAPGQSNSPLPNPSLNFIPPSQGHCAEHMCKLITFILFLCL